jgi:hypothetical protein
VLHQQLPLLDRDVVRARRLHNRRERSRYDEHRPAHAEHPDQRTIVVQRTLRGRNITPWYTGGDTEVDRSRVGGVQRDQRSGRLDRIGRLAARAEPMPAPEPRAPLVHPDPHHPQPFAHRIPTDPSPHGHTPQTHGFTITFRHRCPLRLPAGRGRWTVTG